MKMPEPVKIDGVLEAIYQLNNELIKNGGEAAVSITVTRKTDDMIKAATRQSGQYVTMMEYDEQRGYYPNLLGVKIFRERKDAEQHS